MLREVWPHIPARALPDLWEKIMSSCASRAKNSHTSFFLQVCHAAADSDDVSLYQPQLPSLGDKFVGREQLYWCRQRAQPAQPCLQLEPKAAASREGTRQAHTALPLWTLPPFERCQLRGFLCSVPFVESVTCSGSHHLPVACPTSFEPTLVLVSMASSGEGFPGFPPTARGTSSWCLVWAWLWLASFDSCQDFTLEETDFSQSVHASDAFHMCHHIMWSIFQTAWCRATQTCRVQKPLRTLECLCCPPLNIFYYCFLGMRVQVSHGFLQWWHLHVSCCILCSFTKSS